MSKIYLKLVFVCGIRILLQNDQVIPPPAHVFPLILAPFVEKTSFPYTIALPLSLKKSLDKSSCCSSAGYKPD